MEIRDPAMQEAPQPRRGDPAPAPVDSVSYRVDSRFTAVKICGFAIFTLAALAFHDDRAKLAFTGLAALVAGGYALRDLIAPVRLAADREGITVISGYAGHRRLEWDVIERIPLDERPRL